jgi:dihydroflavonol-4-reductase
MMGMQDKKVLLTGVSGFLGSHTAIQLLNKGYRVTGTLRNMDKAGALKEVIAAHTPHVQNLGFAEADLLDGMVWDKLAKGMDCIMHIASPFPREQPKNEMELIGPAKEGTLNVLNAAQKNGVKRVVLTSSIASIIYGKEKDKRNGTFNENHWTDENNYRDTSPYVRSKTIAEKSAWEFVGKQGNKLELTVVCPGAVLGPVLEKDYGTSAILVVKLLDGSTPALANLGYEIADVRSVAQLHILAMESERAANHRYVATAQYMSMYEIANVLREKYPDRKIPSLVMPNFLIRFYSIFEKELKPYLFELGTKRVVENSKPLNELGWKPIPAEEAVLSCADSVLKMVLTK